MDINTFKTDISKCVEHVKEDLSQIRTGRATPELVEEVLVNAYGTQSPVKNLASISVIDAKTINIQPWDKSILEEINKGVSNANLGFSPIMEGDRVIVKIPDLTEERRQEYVKIMKERIEDGRVAVRQVRQKYMQGIDEAQKGGLSEDQADMKREEAEKVVKDANEQIENIKNQKEEELLTI
ncbi:MAG TPA: ribosome recycling factor [Candidatus Dojkabacteria bacterium]|nr:ribosome recycling factor [Candidatus Dojkabacteria bacterium]